MAAIPLVSCPVSAAAQTSPRPSRRVAQVLGNGGYLDVPALRNPVNDARAMAAKLDSLGFTTELALDGNKAAMLQAVSRLGQQAHGAEVAVLYYAGHAVELEGRNLLLSVAATASNLASFEREAVSFDEILGLVSGKARTTIVFFDACRDNPFAARVQMAEASSRGRGIAPDAVRRLRSIGNAGLAPVSSRAGTLIAFSTAPGSTALDGAGDNSPFTEALLQHLDTPGLEVRQMLGLVRRTVREATEGRQVPWDNSSLEQTVFLAAHPAAPSVAVNRLTQRTRQVALENDLRFSELVRVPERTATRGAEGLLGAWGGPDFYSNRRQRGLLVVERIDPARGTAFIWQSTNGWTDSNGRPHEEFGGRFSVQLYDGFIEWNSLRVPGRFSRYRLAEGGSELHGEVLQPNGDIATIRMRRIE